MATDPTIAPFLAYLLKDLVLSAIALSDGNGQALQVRLEADPNFQVLVEGLDGRPLVVARECRRVAEGRVRILPTVVHDDEWED